MGLVRQKLVRCSCVCHGLEAHLCILSLILDLLWCELFFWFSILYWLAPFKGQALLDCEFSPLQPILYSFRSLVAILAIPLYYSCCGVIWPVTAGPLWAYCMFFSQWLNMVVRFILMLLWAFSTHYIACAGSFVPFLSSWASLTHLLSLGLILGPFSNSSFPWAFTNFFGLPWPNYLILHPWGSWVFHKPLTFLFHYF